MTALHLAAINGHLECLEFLVNINADIIYQETNVTISTKL
jgi:hypothetical protein